MAVIVEDFLLDLAEASKAAQKFRDDFIANVKSATSTGSTAFQEFKGKTDAELAELSKDYKKYADEQVKATKKRAEEEEQAIRHLIDEQIALGQEARKENNQRQEEILNKHKQIIDERIALEERIARETKELEDKAAEEAKQATEKRGQAMEKFANEARGFIGDVGDAVGALGKGLFGLSESQQLVADKTIYMTEKGAALGGVLGGLLGPLGMLAGSGVGAAVGGLLGYFAGNQEAAAKEAENLNKQLKEQEKNVKDLVTVWNRANKAKEGVEDIAKSYDDLATSIDKTLNKVDLSKVKQSDLTKTIADDEKILADAKAAAYEKRHKVDEIETEINRIKLKQTDDANAKTRDLEEQETALAAAKKEYNNFAEQANLYLKEYNEYTAESEKRTKANTKELKKQNDAYKEYADIFDGVRDTDYLTKQGDAEEKARDENLRRQAEYNAKLIQQDQATQEELARIANIKTKHGLLMDQEERDKQAAEIEAWANTVNGAIAGIGSIAEEALAGVATDAFHSWLEAIATGADDADRSFKKVSAAFVRNIGEQLFADGIKNILQGTANLLTGQPAGGALIGVGTAELAAAATMGRAGARAQRRQGYGDEEVSPSTGSRGGSASGGSSLGSGSSSATPGTVIYQIYAGGAPGSTTINAGDGPASTAKAYRELNRISTQGQRIGSGGFSRRTP